MSKQLERFSPTFLFIIPLVLTLWWRPFLADSAYASLAHASQAQPLLSPHTLTAPLPLWTILLGLINHVWFPALLSACGWAIAGWQFKQGLQRCPNYQSLALLGALLLVLSPVQFNTLGLPLGWVLALALWLTTERSRPIWQGVSGLLLLLFIWPDWSLAVLGLFWLAWQAKKGWGWIFAAAASLIILGLRGPYLHLSLWADFQTAFSRLLYESQLYWIAIPLFLLGIGTLIKQADRQDSLWLWLAWLPAALMTDPLLGQAVLVVVLTWLVVLGFQQTILVVQQQTLFTIAKPSATILTIAIGVTLTIALSMSLVMRYRLQPWAHLQAEEAVVTWFEQQELKPQTLAGSSRLGWLLNSVNVAWEKGETVGDYGMMLVATHPEWVVSEPTLAWQQLTNSNWFQDWYEIAYITSNFERPLTVWHKNGPLADTLPTYPINVVTPLNLSITGYRYSPLILEPGGTVTVALIMRADGPVTPFNTIINVTNPIEGIPYAQIDVVTPDNISNDWWQKGQTLSVERSLTVVPEIPIGAYPINLVLRKTIGLDPLTIYRDGDNNPLDQVLLGYVAVPWIGEPSGELLHAKFADGIQLYSALVEGAATPGGQLTITLYWQTEQTPTQNYNIFVHLVDSAGNLVAGSDGVPFGGRYPTRGWHPGTTIPHEHHLNIPADLPAGIYSLRTGVYLPESGERLPVTNKEGEQPADRALLWQTLTIGE